MMRRLFAILILLSAPLALRADITTGLVGQWDCQDNAASTTVVATVGTNAALINAGNTSASSVAGPGGSLTKALALDGGNDFITGAATGGTGAATIAGWFKVTSITANQYAIDWGSGATDTRSIIVGFQDNYWNGYHNAYPISGVAANSQMAATAGGWQFVVITSDGSTYQGYVNGTQIVTGSGNLNRSSTPTAMDIGSAWGGTSPFGGSVAGIRFYNRVFTAADVRELMAHPFSVGSSYADSIDDLLGYAPAGSYMDVFSTLNYSGSSTFNPYLWGGGGTLVDWTPVMWRCPNDPDYAKGVAITKRHVITTEHNTYDIVAGDTLYFVAADGSSVSRTVGGVASFVSSPDALDSFRIAYITSDLPSTIHPAPLMADRATATSGLPVIKLDQEHHASIANVSTDNDSGLVLADAGSGTRHTYYEDGISGDSGSPFCYLVGNQLIYSTSYVVGGGGTGPNDATRIAWILKACRDLDTDSTGYVPTLYGIGNTAARRATTRRAMDR